MAEIITNLHPDGDENTNLYPNIKKENIPSKSISTDKLDDNVLSLIGSLKPSGTDTSANILAFTYNKGIYVATDNGHWYYWNGSAYTDGGVYQSSEAIEQIKGDINELDSQLSESITDILGNVNGLRKDIFNPQINLFNRESNAIINGKYVMAKGLRPTDGVASGYRITHPIRVTGGISYKLPFDNIAVGETNPYYGICDENGNWLESKVGTITGTFFTFTPEASCYVILNIGKLDITTFMVCEADLY